MPMMVLKSVNSESQTVCHIIVGIHFRHWGIRRGVDETRRKCSILLRKNLLIFVYFLKLG